MTVIDMAALISACAALLAAVGSVAGLVSSRRNAKAIGVVHLTMNSRLDELLRVSIAAAHADGLAMGIAQGNGQRNPVK